MPVHFGGMSDPFQPAEKHYQVSLKVLEYLCKIEYPIVISTKSTLVSDPLYLKVLQSNPNIVVQFSFSSLRDEVSMLVEPYSTNPSELQRTIETLSKNNIRTAIRWQPYIVGVSESVPEFVKGVSSLGAFHIGFEHLKMPVEKNAHLWKKVNEYKDIQIYKDKAKTKIDGREIVLKPEYKIAAALEVKSECHKRSMNFGCADNEIQYLSDNSCCCSGIDYFPEHSNFYKYTMSYAVKCSMGEKIKFSTISSEWHPKGSIDKHINSDSRITAVNGHNTVSNYIVDRWQRLNSRFNPTSFYGVEYYGEKDQHGFNVYEWNNGLIDVIKLPCK